MIRLILGLSLTLVFGLTVGLPHAAAQDDTYTVSISALNCPTEEDAAAWSPANPDSPCDQPLGVSFTAEDAVSGVEYGSCVSDSMPPSMGIGCSVDVPVGAEAWVGEDTSTLPAGYLPVTNPIVTAQPAEGGPASANFINVLQEAPPAQQEGTYNLAIYAINCPTAPGPDEFAFSDWQHPCEPAPGIGFFVQQDGVDIGSCVTVTFDAPEPQATASCIVPVPFGSTVTVIEDVSTVPEGYIAVDPPVIEVTAPSGPDSTDQPGAYFYNVQGTPIGGEPEPPSDTGDLTPQLPNTGAGPTLKQLVSFFR
jgi:hypothetical protein